MLKTRIKDILKDSSIYGLSKIAGQAIGFFLIPLYTEYLSPEDYGTLNILGVAAVSFGLIMNFGLDSATYRFAGLAKSEEEQGRYLGTAQWMNLSSILLFLLGTLFFLKPLARLLLEEGAMSLLVVLGLSVGVFSSISAITRAFLRIKRRAKDIAIASLVNIFVSLGSTLLLVVVLEKGVMGALLGNLMGAVASSITIFIAGHNGRLPVWDSSLAGELIRYALPVLPARLLAFAIPLYSQWSVKELLSLKELGLYAVALKFTLPVTLVLGMFQQAYAPYKYEILRTDANPKQTFRQIMSLFVPVFGMLVLGITAIGPEVLKFMTTPEFHKGGAYIFSIALIPFVQGLSFMFSAGQEFAKSPVFKPVISGIGLLVLLLSNHSLIGAYGVNGAAISISLAWFSMAIGNLIYSAKLYYIPYNWPLIIGPILIVTLLGFIVNKFEIPLVWRIIGFCFVAFIGSIWISRTRQFKSFLRSKRIN